MSVLPSEARRVGHKIKCPPFGEEGRRTFMPEGWLLIPTAAAVTMPEQAWQFAPEYTPDGIESRGRKLHQLYTYL